jgi:hypothetical protein
MPLSYLALIFLLLLGLAIGRTDPASPERHSSQGGSLVLIGAVVVVLIAAFTVMFLMTFCAVIVLAWLRSI